MQQATDIVINALLHHVAVMRTTVDLPEDLHRLVAAAEEWPWSTYRFAPFAFADKNGGRFTLCWGFAGRIDTDFVKR